MEWPGKDSDGTKRCQIVANHLEGKGEAGEGAGQRRLFGKTWQSGRGKVGVAAAIAGTAPGYIIWFSTVISDHTQHMFLLDR